jgi:gliding motility-associated-like protein
MLKRLLLPCLVALLGSANASAQLVVNGTMTAQQLVQNVLLGGGVTAFNVRYNGVLNPPLPQVGSGSFTANGTNLGLASGVLLSTGDIDNAVGPSSNFSGDMNGTGSDPDLVNISGGTINDRAVLEFDFIPTGDTLRFRYVFASEEYPNFVCSYNDAFGFFLSGPGITGPFTGSAANIALIPNSTTPVTINTVNNGYNNDPNDPTCPAVNPQYYVNNSTGTTIAYNGFTVVLTAFALVECGQTYHIKLALGDALDTSYDSGVFLEAGSFASTGQVEAGLTNGVGINGDTMLEGCGPYEIVFTRLGDVSEADTVSIIIAGTATPNVDYSPSLPTELIFPADQQSTSLFVDVPMDADGQETLLVQVEQLVECAGVVIQTLFTFYIDSPPPLDVSLDDLNSVCGQVNVLSPTVSGGIGDYTYLWSTGETTPTISVSPGVTTDYSVTVNDVCGVAEVVENMTITLPIYPPLEITVSPETLIPCLGTGPIEVTSAVGGNNVFTYNWTANGAFIGNTATVDVPAGPPTWYIVTVGEGCGTSVQDSVLVGTEPLPPIVVTVSDDVTVICPGDTTEVSVVAVTGGNGVYTYEWTNENGSILSTTDALEVGVPTDQAYTVTVADQCGYEGSAVVNTLLPNYEPFQLSVPLDMIICAGESAELFAEVTGGSGYYTILWHGPDSLSDPIQYVSPDEDTEYFVTVTDRCGAQRTDDIVVAVEHVFTSIVVTNMGQDDWYLQAATLPYARNWIWEMGDEPETIYRDHEVYHSYLDLEDHWVTLKIVTPNGCPGIDSVLLRAPAHIYFPNAFTPDGDGINDDFGPMGHDISVFEMNIFNRWGELLFTTTNPAVRWDGKVNGSDVAMTGVYVYKYRAEGHYFPPQEGIGHVTLIKGTQD